MMRRPRLWEVLPAAAAVLIITLVGVHALASSRHVDFNAYWNGARLALHRGDPWVEPYWVGTPGALVALAPLARLAQPSAAAVMTWLNIGTALGLLTGAHLWIRARTAPWFAWLVTLALAGWAPLASTFWWKQINLVVLGIGVAGFALVRRCRIAGGLLIGLSIAVKPLLVLLPLYLLLRRRTIPAAIVAGISAVGLTLLGLMLLGEAGGNPSATDYYQQFDTRIGAFIPGSLGCNPANMSPTAIGCHVFGMEHPEVRPLILVAVALVALGVGWWLRRAAAGSLVLLAWAGLLSPLLGTALWPHYLVFAAPMVCWAAVAAYRRPYIAVPLVLAWICAEIEWTPAMSLPAQIRVMFGGAPETTSEIYTALRVSAAAVALLAIAGVLSGAKERLAPRL